MKKYKTIIVGFGKVADSIVKDKKMSNFFKYQSHAQVLNDHPNFDWIAVVDPNEEALKSARENWKINLAVKYVKDLPKNLDPDVIVLATKTDIRLEVIKSFKNLKGLIIEKPLASSIKERKQLLNYCLKNKIKVNVNLFRRFDKLTSKFSKDYFLKKIGNIQFGTIIYGNGLRNNGIHFIDQIRMLGAEIEFVQALNEPQKATFSSFNDDININVLLGLKNGALILMHPLDFSYYREQLIDIWGSKGKLMIFQEGIFFKLSSLQNHRAMDSEIEISLDNEKILKSSVGRAIYDLYTDLYQAIKNNTETNSNIQNATQNEEIIDNIFKSIDQKSKRIFI